MGWISNNENGAKIDTDMIRLLERIVRVNSWKFLSDVTLQWKLCNIEMVISCITSSQAWVGYIGMISV